MNKYESESNLWICMDVIKIFAILAAIPAYLILMGFIASVTLPVYVLTSEINKETTNKLPSFLKPEANRLNVKATLEKITI